MGVENVGKSTFLKRLIGTKNKTDNENAYKWAQTEKLKENITHGVDIVRWKNEENGTLFSLWDFAGAFFF